MLGTEAYQPPAQGIDIIDSTSELRCRIELPIHASSLARDGPDALILTDALEAGEAYRVQYRCPGG